MKIIKESVSLDEDEVLFNDSEIGAIVIILSDGTRLRIQEVVLRDVEEVYLDINLHYPKGRDSMSVQPRVSNTVWIGRAIQG